MESIADPTIISLSAAVSAHPDQDSSLPGDGTKVVRNVVNPTLAVYLPSESARTGAGVVVCPGGAFRFLSIEHEGSDVAQWLVERGITAFVLRYSVAPTPVEEMDFHDWFRAWASPPRAASEAERAADRAQMEKVIGLAVEDGRQAMSVVREHAAEWGLDRGRIGALGFSAGGTLVSRLALAQDTASRPDFVAPIYGASGGEVAIPADAPPAFIMVCDDDPLAASRCVALAAEWREAGRSVELHLYAKGGHGFGMRQRGLPVDSWIQRFYEWMGSQGIIER